jgi:hypothetical protein
MCQARVLLSFPSIENTVTESGCDVSQKGGNLKTCCGAPRVSGEHVWGQGSFDFPEASSLIWCGPSRRHKELSAGDLIDLEAESLAETTATVFLNSW